MNTPYSYVTLRYVHDVVSGEFVNVGVVLYAPDQRFLDARFTTSYARLTAMFVKVDHEHYRSLVRYFQSRVAELSFELRDALKIIPLQGIADLVHQILPADDSSLQWSTSSGGLSTDLKKTLEQLHQRLVEQYVSVQPQQGRRNSEIARPFKEKLVLHKVSQLVTEKHISAKDYERDFQYAWKNSVWHLYEPASFDLLEPKSILEKGVRWFGRARALQSSTEPFKLHLLLGEPQSVEGKKAFQHAIHLLQEIPSEIELVRENKIESFAESVAKEIEEHREGGH